MINDFIIKTIEFLKRSDVRFHLPEHREVELSNNTQTVNITCEESFNKNRLNDNLIIHSMIFFSLFDAYIDSENQQYEGLSFRRKYDKLPCTTDYDIILKELYRILKVLRNTTVHSKSHISFNGKEILINYKFKGTNFKLLISKLGLELIYSAILLVIDNRYLELYKAGLLREYYNEILLNIKDLKDDIGHNNFKYISDGIRLKRHVRYRVINPDFSIDYDKEILYINKYKYECSSYSADYLIEYNEGKYIIPEEILNDNRVLIKEISGYKIIDIYNMQ